MSKLQIQYAKELAKGLGKIAVYLPGESIEVGDIITFPNGKSFFGNPRPIGTFKKITSLKNLGITYEMPQFSGSPDSYHFMSKNAINFNIGLNGDIESEIETIPSIRKTLNIKFTSEGAIYFLANDCDKKELGDLVALEKEINAKGKTILWKDTYLVTSVTIAKKALIMQSRSKSSEISLEGSVDGIQSGIVDASDNIQFNLKGSKGDVFIKNWSDDVTVFMDVVRFEKEIFESESYRSPHADEEEQEILKLTKVPVEELLID